MNDLPEVYNWEFRGFWMFLGGNQPVINGFGAVHAYDVHHVPGISQQHGAVDRPYLGRI